MGRLAGSWANVVGGISEQTPQSRRSGQHTAQVNMISDPVRGACRRHGSIMQAEKSVSIDWATLLNDTANSVTIQFNVGATEYDLVIRQGAGSASTIAYCFDKTNKAFINIVHDGSAVYASLATGGVSAHVNVGRYLYLAGNTIVPEATGTDVWGALSNRRKLVGWVRGGAYSRKFTAIITKADGTTISGTYTTDAAGYPGVLDTSDLDYAADSYQSEVNNRTNAYNTAVTQWIGTAATSITPGNIATQLASALVTAGATGVTADGAYVLVQNDSYVEIELLDNGDGSLVRGVGNTVDTIDEVSSRHFVGKIIKVQPDTNKSVNPFYLMATAKDGVSAAGTFTQVVWDEAAGYVFQATTTFCFATVEAGILYIAGSATSLGAISGIADVPDWDVNAVGDQLSSTLPGFFNSKITAMAQFQDRLLIVSGSTCSFSRTGSYLNFFPKSVLAIAVDDPWEGYALGAENDAITSTAIFDRSLLLFGEDFQYVVSGKVPLEPSTAVIAIMSQYRGGVSAPPKANGNYVYYGKWTGLPGRENSSLHQVQPGLVTDVADTYPVSQVLDTYLDGKPVEIVPVAAPNTVFLRCSGSRTKLYTYAYMDDLATLQRKFDSWSHWEWADKVGSIMGMSLDGSDLLVYFVKQGKNKDGITSQFVSCERFVRDTTLSDYPYMDSLRPISGYTTSTLDTYLTPFSDGLDALGIVFGSGPYNLLGYTADRYSTMLSQYPDLSLCYVGVLYDAYVTPTNPFARDRNGVAILGGRLTLQNVKASVEDTGGLQCVMTTKRSGVSTVTFDFSGRVLGASTNLIGRQPVVTSDLSMWLGGESREIDFSLKAKTWLPFTLTALEWQGQFFYNTRRG